jgi:hypothetical protein
MSKRVEQVAFHYRDDIVWLAYRYSGGDKEEIVYTAGWSFDGDEGASRYVLLRKVLNDRFGFDSKRPFLSRNGVNICGVGSVFIGCDQVFIDADFPVEEKVIMQAFFMECGLECIEVQAPQQDYETVNARWAEALGEDVGEDELGGVRALSVMSAAISDKVGA